MASYSRSVKVCYVLKKVSFGCCLVTLISIATALMQVNFPLTVDVATAFEYVESLTSQRTGAYGFTP